MQNGYTLDIDFGDMSWRLQDILLDALRCWADEFHTDQSISASGLQVRAGRDQSSAESVQRARGWTLMALGCGAKWTDQCGVWLYRYTPRDVTAKRIKWISGSVDQVFDELARQLH